MRSLFNVVIPAYDCAATVERSMMSLARQRFDGDLRVVVAVNGDGPDTLAAAQRLAPELHAAGVACAVIHTPKGRAVAFNAAERLLPPGPRLYLDQDAVLSPDAIATLAAALAPGTGVHFAALALRIAPCRSAVTRAYYRIWRELPYVKRSPVTVGAYAVSAEGRQRWTAFPEVHSDDKFARLKFATHERTLLVSETYEVMVPDGVRALIRARCRYRRGNRELAELAATPDLSRREGAVLALARRPALWGSSAVFLAVHAAAAVLDGWSRPGPQDTSVRRRRIRRWRARIGSLATRIPRRRARVGS